MGNQERKEKIKKAKAAGLPAKGNMSEAEVDQMLAENSNAKLDDNTTIKLEDNGAALEMNGGEITVEDGGHLELEMTGSSGTVGDGHNLNGEEDADEEQDTIENLIGPLPTNRPTPAPTHKPCGVCKHWIVEKNACGNLAWLNEKSDFCNDKNNYKYFVEQVPDDPLRADARALSLKSGIDEEELYEKMLANSEGYTVDEWRALKADERRQTLVNTNAGNSTTADATADLYVDNTTAVELHTQGQTLRAGAGAIVPAKAEAIITDGSTRFRPKEYIVKKDHDIFLPDDFRLHQMVRGTEIEKDHGRKKSKSVEVWKITGLEPV